MRRRIFFALFFSLFSFVTSQPGRTASLPDGYIFYPGVSIHFEHFTIEDGLSQNAVLTILQDHQGYLWVGTQGGLNRYDGYSFHQFLNNPDDPASISFNSITALYEDSSGDLWVGTWGGGLNRYDPSSGKFTRYLPDVDDPSSLANPIVTSIVQDPVGRLWVGTLGGLELLDVSSGRFTHFHTDPADPSTLSSDAISAITPAGDGTLWIGTGAFGVPGNGLNRFDPITAKAERIRSAGSCLQSLTISSILRDKYGGLWIGHGGSGLPGGGLDHYTPATDSCQHYDASTTAGQFLNDNVTRLEFDQEGRLWISVWGGGLLLMTPDMPGVFESLRYDAYDPNSLSSDNTSTVYADRSGVLWVGLFDRGLDKLNLENLQFRTYTHDPANPSSIASNRITAFAETRDGKIWIGTQEIGLANFKPATGEMIYYRYIPSNPTSLSSNRVSSLYADADGTLWIGTVNEGLNHFDPATGEFQHFYHDSADIASLIDDEITYITRDSAGTLWVATMGGLSRLDPDRAGFVNYSGLVGAPVSLMTDGSDLWIGTWGGGASRLRLALPGILPPDRTRFTIMDTLQHDPLNSNSLSENSVWTMYHALDGIFWFGTAGGLNRYDPKTGKFKIYTEKQGLPNSNIRCVVQDPNGYLWVATTNGLARFDPLAETTQVYDEGDGLQGNEFDTNACFLSPSTGDIYVGGTEGFTVFNPLTIKKNTTSPTVVIQQVRVFNEVQAIDGQGKNPLRLRYDQNTLSFDFAALDYHAPEKNTYMYKLEGFDANWIQAGTQHTANYADLPSGNYAFRVKAANSDGNWSTSDAALSIQIVPPFWNSWQFQVGLVVVLLSMIVGGFQWRLRSIKNNAQRLEQRMAERTKELNQANELLREKATQDAVSAERTRLARELHDAVTQTLFSATLIADVLPDLWGANKPEGERRLEELRQLTRGALAEMRTLLVELRPNALVEAPLPALLQQLTEALAGRERIEITLQTSGERKLPADVQIGLYRIAQEALNNVVKHARATQVVIALRLEDPVRLTIADNGSGFDPRDVSADHLGLKIMRERAEAIGASLSIESESGGGAQITVIW